MKNNNKINPYMTDDIEKILSSEGIEIDKSVKIYLTEIKRVPYLTPETEKQFLQNLDDNKSRNKLVESYLRFVVMIAKEYVDSDNSLLDITANGNLGLISAVESFSNTENISFAEYAEKCIRHVINTGIEFNANAVRIPVFTFNTIERSMNENRSITVKKLADVLQHTEFDARQIDSIYGFCKKRSINIIPSADPYINYDPNIETDVLSTDTETKKALEEYLAEIKQTVPYLTPETEKQFLKNLDDPKVKQQLSYGYLRFVVMIAREYVDSNNELIMLTASGNEGLRKAVESFGCTENISFLVFAEWLIRQEILKGIRQHEEYMKIPIFYKRKK